VFQQLPFHNLNYTKTYTFNPAPVNSFLKTGSGTTAIPLYIKFSPSPRVTGMFPVQKWLLK